jgi:hypothetical protein
MDRGVIGFAALLGLVTGCAGQVTAPAPSATRDSCRAMIIIQFKPNGDESADSVLAELSRAANLKLSLVREIAPTTVLAELIAADDQSDCQAAIARLRQDTQVTSVDIEAQRHHHGGNP